MNLFGLQDKGTNFVAEMLAGITAFITAAYLPMQCAQLMSSDAESQIAAYVAICLSAFIGCMLMGFFANQPFIAAPSVGMTTFFTVTLLSGMNYSFAQGMALMMLAGLIFFSMSFTGLMDKILGCMPQNMKNAVSAGLGIYIALLGLRNAGFISPNAGGGWGILNLSERGAAFFTSTILVIGLLLICMFKRFNIPSPILVGVIASGIIYYMIGIPSGFVEKFSLKVNLSDTGHQLSLWAASSLFKNITHGISQLFGSVQMTAKSILTLVLLVLVCALFNSLESTGVVYATARTSGTLDDGGSFPEMRKTMTANSVTSIISSCFGSPSVAVLPESNAAAVVNGKTGLTAVTAGFMFLAAIIFAPFMKLVPAAVTAAVLVYVGIMMISPVKDIDFGDINESLPAFVTMIVIPFTSSVIDGIALGLIMHIVMNLCTFRFKSIKLLELIIAVIFAAKYFLI